MSSGKFITFEGGEGAGKSTQAKALADRLTRAGFEPLQTREPGGTPRAEAIRDLILSGKAKEFGALGETVLFYAARESHLQLAIRPALASGKWVICDRFSDSTRAYQGAAAGVSKTVIETFEAAVVGPTRPDLTLILDIKPEVGLRRAVARGKSNGGGEHKPDRFESMDLAFQNRLRDSFLEIAEDEPERCVVFDGAMDEQRLSDQIWAVVRQRLNV